MLCFKGLAIATRENRMTTKVKKIKALLGFHGTADTDLLKRLNTAHDGVNGNAAFPTPPVDMATFKSGIDSLTVLVSEAEDGGKKAISAKNKQRELMIKQYTLLGHYVEVACNDDPAIFNTSGFVAAPIGRVPPRSAWRGTTPAGCNWQASVPRARGRRRYRS